MQTVRVRYAPSPTGLQHIGGLRTALFNYLFARSQGGQFIVRVEDTDQQRSRPAYLEDLRETLAWAGLDVDEGFEDEGADGPYIQSRRQRIYREHAEKLLASGHAYHCFCSAEELNQLRRRQEAEGSRVRGYDRRCRGLDAREAAQRAKHDSSVLRFKVPLEGSTTISDLLLGEVKRENSEINPDPVLLKVDGWPTYHLANVVDDHLMRISHVLRAQEWLPSAALHLLLYQAFGWEAPQFCHLPMVLGKDGAKLSKRHGATSVREFRDQGYLPEALVNYMALLGWSLDGVRELFGLDELRRLFSLERLSNSPAIFDYQKLDWFNGVYLRALPAEEFARQLGSWLVASGLLTREDAGTDKLLPLVPLAQPRLTRWSDAAPMLRYLFRDPDDFPLAAALPRKVSREQLLSLLDVVDLLLAGFDWRCAESMEARARELAGQRGVKLGALLQPLRVAVTGSKVSPPLFPSLVWLGERRTGERWQRFCCRTRDEG